MTQRWRHQPTATTTRQGRCVLIVCIADGVVALAAAQAGIGKNFDHVVCLSHRRLGEKDLIIVAVCLLIFEWEKRCKRWIGDVCLKLCRFLVKITNLAYLLLKIFYCFRSQFWSLELSHLRRKNAAVHS